MKALVIGADGSIGCELVRWLALEGHEAIGTSRRSGSEFLHLDLEAPEAFEIPEGIDVAYLCAAYNGFRRCEGSRSAWRVNVDGTIALAKRLMQRGILVVFLSSDSVEWSDAAYARHKALVEMFLQAFQGPSAIVRLGRVTPANSAAAVNALIRVGMGRINGITLWDESRAA